MFAVSGASWTPASLPGLQLWVENDPTTMFTDAGITPVSASGQTVKQWNDKSGHARNLNSDAGATYTTGTKPYLQFNGTSSTIQNSSNTIPLSDASGYFYLAVAVSFDTNTGLQIAASGIFSGNNSPRLGNSSCTSQGIVHNTTPGLTTDNGPALTAGTPVVLIMTVSSTGVETFVDNVSNGATAMSNPDLSTVGNFYVGSLGAGTNFTGGKIFGSVLGTGTLSSTDRASLQTYMHGLP